MKFLADEGIDQQVVNKLRQAGHTVWYVAEMERGISDDEVLNLANQKKAILLTTDKDFGELIFRQRRITTGIILLRLAGLSPESKGDIVLSVMDRHSEEIKRGFSVITPGVFRIRHKT